MGMIRLTSQGYHYPEVAVDPFLASISSDAASGHFCLELDFHSGRGMDPCCSPPSNVQVGGGNENQIHADPSVRPLPCASSEGHSRRSGNPEKKLGSSSASFPKKILYAHRRIARSQPRIPPPAECWPSPTPQDTIRDINPIQSIILSLSASPASIARRPCFWILIHPSSTQVESSAF